MHAVQTSHRENPEIFRSRDHRVPPLRWAAGARRIGARYLLQGWRLVCGWLRQRQTGSLQRREQERFRRRACIVDRILGCVEQGCLSYASFRWVVHSASCPWCTRACRFQLRQEIASLQPRRSAQAVQLARDQLIQQRWIRLPLDNRITLPTKNAATVFLPPITAQPASDSPRSPRRSSPRSRRRPRFAAACRAHRPRRSPCPRRSRRRATASAFAGEVARLGQVRSHHDPIQRHRRVLQLQSRGLQSPGQLAGRISETTRLGLFAAFAAASKRSAKARVAVNVIASC